MEIWKEGSPTLLDLTEGFEEADADGGGEIEAAGRVLHWNAEAVVRILVEEGFREAFGFTAENQEVALLVVGIPKRASGLGGEHPGTGPWGSCGLKFLPVGPDMDIAFLPVINARAAEGFFIEGKPEGPHEVQACAGGLAKASDVAGVGRDFGFDEDHVQHGAEIDLGSSIFQGKKMALGKAFPEMFHVEQRGGGDVRLEGGSNGRAETE